MNGMKNFVDLNIMPLGSYDVLINMDWLDAHHAILDFHNKTYTCLDEEGNQVTVEGIPRPISLCVVKEIVPMDGVETTNILWV